MKTLFLLMLTAAYATSAANGATIRLHQGGWSDGGPLSVVFTGQDTDSNGAFEDFELTAFTGTFWLPDGGTAVLGLEHIDVGGFYWESPTNYFIKVDSPEYSLYDITTSGGGAIALFSDFTGAFVSISSDALTAVPEPSTGAVAASCVLALAVIRKRLRR